MKGLGQTIAEMKSTVMGRVDAGDRQGLLSRFWRFEFQS